MGTTSAEGNPPVGLIERPPGEPRRLIVTILLGDEPLNQVPNAHPSSWMRPLRSLQATVAFFSRPRGIVTKP